MAIITLTATASAAKRAAALRSGNDDNKERFVTYSCQCPCGTTSFEVPGEPITRFYCPCTICQKQYDAPFIDVTLFKLDDVVLPENHAISFARYKRFLAVDRGRCPACSKPVLSKLGEREKGFAFVATRNYVNPEALPAANMHIFYGTRVTDVIDDLPKYKSSIASFFAVFKRMRSSTRNKPR